MLIRAVDRPLDVMPPDLWNALFAANAVLIDELITGLQELSQGVPVSDLAILTWLPARYASSFDQFFLRRLLVCLTAVGLKMRLPDFHPAGCVAEELCIYMTLQCAESLDEDHTPEEFAVWRERALRRRVVEQLFGEARGFSPGESSDLSSVERWFEPFTAADVVHPYASEAGLPDWAL
jgi:hypothetical protein